MRANWIRILFHWLQLEGLKAERIGQAWLERTVTLAGLFLILEALGLIFRPFANITLALNVIFGLVLTYRAWSATVVLDVGENLSKLFRSKDDDKDKKSGDIQTMKIVGTVLSVIGMFLLLLAIRIYGDFPEGTYVPFITIVVVALFLTGMGAPSEATGFQSIGNVLMLGAFGFLLFYVTFFGSYRTYSQEVTARFNDVKDFGLFYYPSKPGKQVVRNKVRDWAYDRAKHDSARTKPVKYRDLLTEVGVAGAHAADAEEAEERGLAIADRRAIPTRGIVGASARTALWQDSHRVVFKGDLVRGMGEVTSAYFPGISIGPEGTGNIPTSLENVLPYVQTVSHSNACPLYSFCGMVVDKSGVGHVFLIGTTGEVPATGKLFLVVNGPFKGPLGSDAEFFWRMSDGSFQIDQVTRTQN